MQKRGHHWEPVHRATVRHRVAVEAARLLYHREMKEYFQAKREAARRQGTVHLPSNREVHEQLLLIAQRLDGDEHARRLQRMRLAALSLMEKLAAFHPRLIGSVLTGHIRKGSDIDLNLYGDDVDEVCAALDGTPLRVEIVRSRKNQEHQEFTHVHLADVEGFEVEITLYPLSQRHEHPRCGITGGPMRRASLAELRQLVQLPPAQASVEFSWPTPVSIDHLLQWVPELCACRGVLQNNYHHLDVFDHTVEVVRGLERMVADHYARFGSWAERLQAHIGNPTLLYLAGVCHDLGKPATQTYARDGRIRFWGHEQAGAEITRVVAQRLGQPDDLVRLVECHMEAVRIPTEQGEPSRIHALFRRLGPRVPELALLSLADVEAARGPAQTLMRLEEHAQFVDFLLQQHFEQGFLAHPSVPVSVDDLIDQFGVTQPKTQQRLLDWLTSSFVDGEFESKEEGLSLASDFLSDPGHRSAAAR